MRVHSSSRRHAGAGLLSAGHLLKFRFWPRAIDPPLELDLFQPALLGAVGNDDPHLLRRQGAVEGTNRQRIKAVGKTGFEVAAGLPLAVYFNGPVDRHRVPIKNLDASLESRMAESNRNVRDKEPRRFFDTGDVRQTRFLAGSALIGCPSVSIKVLLYQERQISRHILEGRGQGVVSVNIAR